MQKTQNFFFAEQISLSTRKVLPLSLPMTGGRGDLSR